MVLNFQSIFTFYYILLIANFINADVSLSKPVSGKTFTVSGTSVDVGLSWINDGVDPSIDDIESLTFTLCTGTNSDISNVATIAESVPASSAKGSYTASILASSASDGVYFIQVYALYKDGFSIHYSNRFKLSGMSGSTDSSGSLDDASPSAQVSISSDSTATTTDVTATMDVSASFKVPYAKQTGIYRFAPMQTQPGSTVTATTWTRQFPTSAVTYYSTNTVKPVQQSTITPGWSYTKTSYINQASALGSNTNFYAAESVSFSTPFISSNTKVKRFLDLD